ncbi:hypothetical protein WA1_23275 [Scytonema hofmannii PCC 7110]|uniref:Uncharacterized protein n=1 Tax=Scytonema hofmannii PCC 7110 TaxID=128403 RepID=A0A139X8S8_9CYAN|nr:hypothetical protein WA1_23275 [Scytonema hofmannii PCC 7110]
MFDNLIKFVSDSSGLTNQLRIAEWAKLNRVNPFDMGSKNYQRCLYDLGLGGKYHELEYNEDGSLKYQ